MTRKTFLCTTPFAAAALLGADLGREAPELMLTDTTGKPLRLSQHRGKVVAIEFMLTTCPHCQNTAKLMSRLQREFGPRGFQAISLPFNDDAAVAAPRFASEHQLAHPIAAIQRNQVYEFAQLSIVVRHSVPILVFVDRRGRIRAQFEGDADFFQSEEVNFRTKILELLKEPPAKPGAGHPNGKPKSARAVSEFRSTTLKESQ
jgi:peroxiredoxin